MLNFVQVESPFAQTNRRIQHPVVLDSFLTYVLIVWLKRAEVESINAASVKDDRCMSVVSLLRLGGFCNGEDA